MKSTTVNLSPYSDNWAQQFEIEKKKIESVLSDEILAVEHIGSTSIKGLVAKPILDILIAVKNLNRIHDFVSAFATIDYEYVPKPELRDRLFFRKGLWGQGTSHLHICELNSSEWHEKLLFRDYLRAHPEVANDYATLKKRLALAYKHDRHNYTKNKEPFIRAVLEKAKKQAARK